jgi:bifunctional DNA-binding transcriptional regulator/antitoxin component of YhaV-PrlF toxin-antitoxin module
VREAVISKEVHEDLGISPGDEVVFELRNKEAMIKPAGHSSNISELADIVSKKDKLSKDIDVRKLILSETMGR